MNDSERRIEALAASLLVCPPQEKDGVLLVSGFEMTGEELHRLEYSVRRRYPIWQGPMVAMTNIGMGNNAFLAQVPDRSLFELYTMLSQHYEGEGWKRG